QQGNLLSQVRSFCPIVLLCVERCGVCLIDAWHRHLVRCTEILSSGLLNGTDRPEPNARRNEHSGNQMISRWIWLRGWNVAKRARKRAPKDVIINDAVSSYYQLLSRFVRWG